MFQLQWCKNAWTVFETIATNYPNVTWYITLFYLSHIIHTSDTGLGGTNGEVDIPGTRVNKKDQADYTYIISLSIINCI